MTDVVIPGAIEATYTLQPEDVGCYIYCRVTATNVAGSASANSAQVGLIEAAPIAPSNTLAPAVTGTAQEDEVLTCAPGDWDGDPVPTLTYQWKIAPSTDIVGATSDTYTILPGDVGDSLLCTVTASNVAGSLPVDSNTVGPVTAAALPFGYLTSSSGFVAAGTNTLTLPAIDTTGAKLLLIAQSRTAASGAPMSIVDNKGNAWGGIPSISNDRARLHWCVPEAVGSGHTVSITNAAGGIESSATFAAFSLDGAPSLDVHNDVIDGATTISVGAGITPTADNALVLFSTATTSYNDPGIAPSAVTAGFTGIGSITSGDYHPGHGAAYLIQTAAALANPTCTIVNPVSWVAQLSSFRNEVWSAPAAPLALLAHTNSSTALGGSVTPNNAVSGAIDTTGATLLVVGVAHYGGSAPVVTDNKGNTWTKLTTAPSLALSTIFYCKPTTVGSGHIVTNTETGSYSNLNFAAFSGNIAASPFDVEANGTDGTVSSTAARTPYGVTPTQNNCLLVANLCTDTDITIAVTNEFTMLPRVPKNPVANQGSALAYKIQSVRAPANPTWTFGGASGWVCNLAAFKHA